MKMLVLMIREDGGDGGSDGVEDDSDTYDCNGGKWWPRGQY